MRLSVVVPLLNEEGSLPELYQRLTATLDKLQCQRQIDLLHRLLYVREYLS